jgi:hypothetical protein
VDSVRIRGHRSASFLIRRACHVGISFLDFEEVVLIDTCSTT